MSVVQTYEGKKESSLPYSNISDAVGYIRNHHHNSISVEDLTQYVCFSGIQLHRKFSQIFGMSMHHFRSKTRIQATSDALIHQNDGIADVTVKLGFCDQSTFTRQFRRQTGMTPLRFAYIIAICEVLRGPHYWLPKLP